LCKLLSQIASQKKKNKKKTTTTTTTTTTRENPHIYSYALRETYIKTNKIYFIIQKQYVNFNILKKIFWVVFWL